MLEREFYCVKCKKRVTVPAADICVKVYKNQRGNSPALVGHCPKCGTKVTKFIKADQETALAKKFGRCR